MDVVSTLTVGGLFMWPILAAGVLAAGISAERMFYVSFRANINASAFMAQVQKLVMANNIDRAIKLCNAEPHAALPKVVKAGLTRAHLSEKEIQQGLEEAVLEVGPLILRRAGYLATIANVATLMGLLGTIVGLIQSFEALASTSAESKQALLAGGIAIAMYTTAAGLVVAIPTLVMHAIITQRGNNILDDIDQHAVRTLNLLTAPQSGPRVAQASTAGEV